MKTTTHYGARINRKYLNTTTRIRSNSRCVDCNKWTQKDSAKRCSKCAIYNYRLKGGKKQMVMLENMSVEAATIAKLKKALQWFSVREAPYYTDLPDPNDPEKKVRKLIIPIYMSNGDELDYIPNRTSQKAISNLTGTQDMDKWIGHKFNWKTRIQMVHGQEKDVLYVDELISA